jgi:hypothetical protein
MSYWLNSENYSIERPLVPRRQFSHHYKKYFIILAFFVESNVEVDILKIRLECSYKPSAEEISKRRFLSHQIKIPSKQSEIVAELGIE